VNHVSNKCTYKCYSQTEYVAVFEHRLELDKYKTEENVSELPTNSSLPTNAHKI